MFVEDKLICSVYIRDHPQQEKRSLKSYQQMASSKTISVPEFMNYYSSCTLLVVNINFWFYFLQTKHSSSHHKLTHIHYCDAFISFTYFYLFLFDFTLGMDKWMTNNQTNEQWKKITYASHLLFIVSFYSSVLISITRGIWVTLLLIT